MGCGREFWAGGEAQSKPKGGETSLRMTNSYRRGGCRQTDKGNERAAYDEVVKRQYEVKAL